MHFAGEGGGISRNPRQGGGETFDSPNRGLLMTLRWGAGGGGGGVCRQAAAIVGDVDHLVYVSP